MKKSGPKGFQKGEKVCNAGGMSFIQTNLLIDDGYR